ncbi:MAG TPA: hypothetical protein VLG11_00475 [Candidatus Saccharimonadales bacterium]|nr:hypothetical protein [Candidatus Saccharimonadales bacterium]
MILMALLTVVVAFIFLAVAEYVARTQRKFHSETMRKTVHIVAGCVVATWPFYFPWWMIGLLGLAALVVIAISLQYKTFHSIYGVNRRSIGEILFAVTIGLLAFLAGNRWIFAAAMLHLGLADGLAAIIGVKYGKRNRYKLLGYYKSWVGTATFFAVSAIIMIAYAAVTHSHDFTLLASVPLLTTLVENFAVAGTDNLLVPLMVAGMLKFF